MWGQPPCNEPNGISSGLVPCPGCQTSYHTYSVVEDRRNPAAEQLRFYTDAVLQYTVNQNQTDPQTWANAVHHGFFLILDVAIGGSYPDKVCGCTSAAANPTSGAAMSVDDVAVYTIGGAPASSSPAPSTSPAPSMSTSSAPSTSTSSAPSTPPPGSVAATSRIQADSYTDQSGTGSEVTTDVGGGYDVGWIGSGDWLRYDRIDFGANPATQFLARVASGAAPGVSGLVEVHLDSRTGPAIGSFAIANTGSWQTWRTVPANISATTGVHTVYISFVSGAAADFVNVNWLQFA